MLEFTNYDVFLSLKMESVMRGHHIRDTVCAHMYFIRSACYAIVQSKVKTCQLSNTD